MFALTKVKGVGMPLANAVCKMAGVDKFMKAGELSDKQIEAINKVIAKPADFKIPRWMVNRRKDPETGEDRHINTNELAFVKQNDIKFLRRIKCYRGVRHAIGLPVRGQKTRSNFRPNKGKVMGVKTSGKKK